MLIFKYRKKNTKDVKQKVDVKQKEDNIIPVTGGTIQSSLTEKLSRLSFIKNTQNNKPINPKLKKFVELKI
jgi:hypothetical protein